VGDAQVFEALRAGAAMESDEIVADEDTAKLLEV
jgi:hypothetical protein